MRVMQLIIQRVPIADNFIGPLNSPDSAIRGGHHILTNITVILLGYVS